LRNARNTYWTHVREHGCRDSGERFRALTLKGDSPLRTAPIKPAGRSVRRSNKGSFAMSFRSVNARQAHLQKPPHWVSTRYERGSITSTSNESYGDWGGVFGDRPYRRRYWLVCCTTRQRSTIRGESYRLTDDRRAVAGRSSRRGRRGRRWAPLQ
jgi:hypothetical protein